MGYSNITFRFLGSGGGDQISLYLALDGVNQTTVNPIIGIDFPASTSEEDYDQENLVNYITYLTGLAGFYANYSTSVVDNDITITAFYPGSQYNVGPAFGTGGVSIVSQEDYVYEPTCDISIIGVTIANDVNAQSVGSITVNATSTFVIQYSLNNVTFQPSNVFTGLISGNYTVYVRDTELCTSSTTATIGNNPCDLVITSILNTNETGVGLNDGTVNASATGTAGSIQFSLDGGAYSAFAGNNASYTGIAPGVHTIYVKDAANCNISQNFTVLEFVVIDPDCFNPTIILSEINPYRFKLLKCNPADETETLYNEEEICGVNKDCFTQLLACDDTITFQVYWIDTLYNTVPKLNVLDYYDDTLYATVNLVALGAGYYKLEKNVNEIAGICEKTVYLVIKSRNNTSSDEYFQHARSEPILVSNYHHCSLLIEYWNDNNFNSMRYEGTADGYVNKMRIFAENWEQDFPQEKVVYNKSNGETVLIKSEVKEKTLLKTGYLPNYLHKKVALALSHQHIKIGFNEYVCDENYSFDKVPKYALSKGKVNLSTKQYLKKNLLK
jgi:hypothetical protein